MSTASTTKTKVTVYEGDTSPLTDTITYPTGSVIDLTGAAVNFYMEEADGTVKINGTVCAVTIDNSAKTIDWQCPIGASDFDTSGLYYPYLVVTYGDGVLETIPLWESYLIQVKPRGLA